MSVWRIVLIVLVTLLVTATLMPMVLVGVPAARDETVGMSIMGAMAIAVFAVIWFVWAKFGARR
jgi:predicted membrane channel-forming protein YqfA (hemolysin III family)